MLKIAGVLLILTGCTGVGLYTAMRYLIRIHLLEEIEQAMQFIYSEIEYAACDMVEIMHMLAARSNACPDVLVQDGRSSFVLRGQTFLSELERTYYRYRRIFLSENRRTFAVTGIGKKPWQYEPGCTVTYDPSFFGTIACDIVTGKRRIPGKKKDQWDRWNYGRYFYFGSTCVEKERLIGK